MVFFLIVPTIMIVAMILVHEAAKFFNVRISYITLLFCVAFSLLADVVAIEISTSPGLEYFVKLFAVIFVAAAVVTAINNFLEVKK